MFKITFVTRNEKNKLLLRTVTLKVNASVTTWSVNVYLHHRILGFVKGNTVSNPLALLHQFGICDLQEASSEGQEDGHLVLKPQTTWQMSACLQQFGWKCLSIHHTALTMHQVTFTFLALWRSILFVTDSIVKVQEHVSQWSFSQSPEFYGDHWQTLWNMTFGVVFHFLIRNVILNKSYSISKYSPCILVSDPPT